MGVGAPPGENPGSATGFRIEVQQFIANEGSLAQMGIELLVVFFRNKEIFVQLDELDEENHPCMNRIQLQPHTSTANFLM